MGKHVKTGKIFTYELSISYDKISSGFIKTVIVADFPLLKKNIKIESMFIFKSSDNIHLFLFPYIFILAHIDSLKMLIRLKYN